MRRYVKHYNTSTTNAPAATNLYDGEIAVGRNASLPRLWTKLADGTISEYVPKSVIDSLLSEKADLSGLTALENTVIEDEETTAEALNQLNEELSSVTTSLSALQQTVIDNEEVTNKALQKLNTGKADLSGLTGLERIVAVKADTSYVTDALSYKADKVDIENALANKADLSALTALETSVLENEEVVTEALFNIKTNKADVSAVTASLTTKQDVIGDLDTIRSGAALGSTAIQAKDIAGKADTSAVTESLATKQDIISDLNTIRSGAALGSTALQAKDITDKADVSAVTASLATKQDIIVDLNTIRSGATAGLSSKESIDDINNTISGDEKTTAIALNQLNLGKANKEDLVTVQSNIAVLSAQATSLAATVSTKANASDLTKKADLSGLTALEAIVNNNEKVVEQALEELHDNKADTSAVTKSLETKQDVITDLETIRSGATLGLTALQANDITGKADITAVTESLTTKQDVISDLDIIRSGATTGLEELRQDLLDDEEATSLSLISLNEKKQNTSTLEDDVKTFINKSYIMSLIDDGDEISY